MTIDNRLAFQLRRVAGKLTRDTFLQQDLMQEMSVCLMDAEQRAPGKTLSWYIKAGEFCARNYLSRGRSIDSFKRRAYGTNLAELEFRRLDRKQARFELLDPTDLRGELAIKDLVERLTSLLSTDEQETLGLLLEGFGVRAVARKRGVTHPVIVKQRRKIAHLASRLLQEAA